MLTRPWKTQHSIRSRLLFDKRMEPAALALKEKRNRRLGLPNITRESVYNIHSEYFVGASVTIAGSPLMIVCCCGRMKYGRRFLFCFVSVSFEAPSAAALGNRHPLLVAPRSKLYKCRAEEPRPFCCHCTARSRRTLLSCCDVDFNNL